MLSYIWKKNQYLRLLCRIEQGCDSFTLHIALSYKYRCINKYVYHGKSLFEPFEPKSIQITPISLNLSFSATRLSLSSVNTPRDLEFKIKSKAAGPFHLFSLKNPALRLGNQWKTSGKVSNFVLTGSIELRTYIPPVQSESFCSKEDYPSRYL